MNGLIPIESRDNRMNKRRDAPTSKTITAATKIKQEQLTRAATVLSYKGKYASYKNIKFPMSELCSTI